MRVNVLDLGLNNLSSLVTTLSDTGDKLDICVVESASELESCDLIVIPGTGSFGAAVSALKTRGLFDPVKIAAGEGVKVLGICLGMQLLGLDSEESPGIQGLGLIPGSSKRLNATSTARVPNIGWEEIQLASFEFELSSSVLARDFYFVHSYFFEPLDPAHVLFTSHHGQEVFAAGVLKDNVMGLQFHPEKSSSNGTELLRAVTGWVNV